MMEDLVEKLLNSGNKLLEAAGKELSKWKKLKHNKQDLEFFLQFNIAHIKFRPKNNVVMQEIVCTSNTQFIEVFSKLKESEKKKALKSKNNGIRTKDPASILTFNLLKNTYNTVSLAMWEIVNFITITPDNIEVLDSFVNNLLRRPVEKDISEEKEKSN